MIDDVPNARSHRVVFMLRLEYTSSAADLRIEASNSVFAIIPNSVGLENM